MIPIKTVLCVVKFQKVTNSAKEKIFLPLQPTLSISLFFCLFVVSFSSFFFFRSQSTNILVSSIWQALSRCWRMSKKGNISASGELTCQGQHVGLGIDLSNKNTKSSKKNCKMCLQFQTSYGGSMIIRLIKYWCDCIGSALHKSKGYHPYHRHCMF